MPIYEYRCESCSHELEALQKFSDAALVTCPACKADALVKRVSVAGFQLKGSGWYVTDFKSGGAKPAAKSDGESKSDGAGEKSDAKAETKSEAKGETKSDSKSESASTKSGNASGPGNSTAST